MLYLLFHQGPKCEVCHSPPPGAEVREERTYNSTPPYVIMVCTGTTLPLLVHIKRYILLNELRLMRGKSRRKGGVPLKHGHLVICMCT